MLVAIPTLNEAGSIAACLRSLFVPFVWMKRATVVVADGGSTDGTQAIVEGLRREFPSLVLVHNPDRLQAGAINRIVRDRAEPHHEIIVRCDAHARYPPGYVRDVAESLRRHDVAALATVMDASGSGGFARAAAAIVDTRLGAGGAAHRGGRRSGPVDHGHHAGMDLAWFQRVGGYDPAFSHNEDAEFDVRLRAAGGRIWMDASIRLSYAMRETPATLARQYWSYGRGRAATIRKHRCWPRLRQCLPVGHVVALTASCGLAPLNAYAFAWPLLYGGLCLGASIWAIWRLRSAAGAWAGLALGLMHTAWGYGFVAGMLAPRRAQAASRKALAEVST